MLEAPAQFRMKQFTLLHGRGSIPVGTDSIVLGSWYPSLPAGSHILDIGTGCGILALMAAQKSPDAWVTGVEPNKEAFHLARLNAQRSPFYNRISLWKGNIQDFQTRQVRQFDGIICNPPYFQKEASCPTHRNDAAKRSISLGLVELLKMANQLLSRVGIFGVILPHQQALQFVEVAVTSGMYPFRQLNIRPNPTGRVKKQCLLMSPSIRGFRRTEIAIHPHSASQVYSDTYKKLTKSFLLYEHPAH